jgi:hypothetical protein
MTTLAKVCAFGSVAAVILASIVRIALAGETPVDGRGEIAQPQADSSWEARFPITESCESIASALIIPISDRQRGEAITLLERSPIVPLAAEKASQLMESQYYSASKLVADRISQLEQERQTVLQTRKGSWSGAHEAKLVQLERLGKNPALAGMAPYLVRAVAQNEATGMFSVRACGEDLVVGHLSLGAARIPTKYPIIVFLDRAPQRAFVTSGTAL